jgi:hypothetical protein
LPDCATVNVGFPLLVELEQTVHSQNEDPVDLACDILVLVLELICSSRNARNVAVERQHTAFFDFLRGAERDIAQSTIPEQTVSYTYRQRLLVISLICGSLCLSQATQCIVRFSKFCGDREAFIRQGSHGLLAVRDNNVGLRQLGFAELLLQGIREMRVESLQNLIVLSGHLQELDTIM